MFSFWKWLKFILAPLKLLTFKFSVILMSSCFQMKFDIPSTFFANRTCKLKQALLNLIKSCSIKSTWGTYFYLYLLKCSNSYVFIFTHYPFGMKVLWFFLTNLIEVPTNSSFEKSHWKFQEIVFCEKVPELQKQNPF